MLAQFSWGGGESLFCVNGVISSLPVTTLSFPAHYGSGTHPDSCVNLGNFTVPHGYLVSMSLGLVF